MKQQPENLRESLWRRKLSAAERAGLRAQPELELEATLTDALAKIPDAPVPSNFTVRVLAAIELEEAQAERSHGWTLNWRALWPRVAVAAAVLIFAGVSIQRYETSSHRTALAKNVVLLAASQPQPSVDALENLDAIQRMSQSARADGDLLAALQ
jgi:negative regulator of sigma E activity